MAETELSNETKETATSYARDNLMESSTSVRGIKLHPKFYSLDEDSIGYLKNILKGFAQQTSLDPITMVEAALDLASSIGEIEQISEKPIVPEQEVDSQSEASPVEGSSQANSDASVTSSEADETSSEAPSQSEAVPADSVAPSSDVPGSYSETSI